MCVCVCVCVRVCHLLYDDILEFDVFCMLKQKHLLTAQSVSGCLASRVSRSMYSETDGTVCVRVCVCMCVCVRACVRACVCVCLCV